MPQPEQSPAKKDSSVGITKALLGLFVLFIAYNMFSGGGSDKKEAEQAAQVEAKKTAECKLSLQCWGDKYIATAGVYCKNDIEKLAKFSARWMDESMLQSKFSQFKWLDEGSGTVTFVGDKLQFQNGFGAYQAVIYECDYDPTTKAVIDVRATPGRL
jgi:hypothetical protein